MQNNNNNNNNNGRSDSIDMGSFVYENNHNNNLVIGGSRLAGKIPETSLLSSKGNGGSSGSNNLNTSKSKAGRWLSGDNLEIGKIKKFFS